VLFYSKVNSLRSAEQLKHNQAEENNNEAETPVLIGILGAAFSA
jgi:hypothetical protein